MILTFFGTVLIMLTAYSGYRMYEKAIGSGGETEALAIIASVKAYRDSDVRRIALLGGHEYFWAKSRYGKSLF